MSEPRSLQDAGDLSNAGFPLQPRGPRKSRGNVEPMAVIGLIGTLAIHGGLIGGVLAYRHAQAQKAPPPPESFVVARLVRLGKKRPANRLPNKIVEPVATRQIAKVDYEADAEDAPRAKKPEVDPKAEVSDRLRNALQRADVLSQGEQEIEQEGDPNGVAGGTATEGGEGDAYMTRIADLWNRTWSLPAIIPGDEATSLYVLVVVHIDQEGNIQLPVALDRPSGNAHFDNSIVSAWAQIRRLPVPPGDRLASILANGIALKLTWKGLQ